MAVTSAAASLGPVTFASLYRGRFNSVRWLSAGRFAVAGEEQLDLEDFKCEQASFDGLDVSCILAIVR